LKTAKEGSEQRRSRRAQWEKEEKVREKARIGEKNRRDNVGLERGTDVIPIDVDWERPTDVILTLILPQTHLQKVAPHMTSVIGQNRRHIASI